MFNLGIFKKHIIKKNSNSIPPGCGFKINIGNQVHDTCTCIIICTCTPKIDEDNKNIKHLKSWSVYRTKGASNSLSISGEKK